MLLKSRYFHINFLLINLVLLFLLSGCVQHPLKKAENEAIITGNEVIQRYHIPGMTVAMGMDGRLVFSEGFGYASLENKLPVTPDTKMRIGSVSKTLTSAAVGKLFDQGKLDLDAPVQYYVDYFPLKRWKITTRLLGGHLAGIRHYRNMEFLSKSHYENVHQGLTIFMNDTLLFQPGQELYYSSYGWNLISAVVEEASGMPFLEYMNREVFYPLGLYKIKADHVDSLINYRSEFYEYDENGQWLNATYVDNSYKWAGGGFLSNSEDLVKFGFSILDNELFSQTTFDTLTTCQTLNNGEKTNCGIGWFRYNSENGENAIGHSGGSVGGQAMFVIYPDKNMVAALIINISVHGFDPMVALEEIIKPYMEL